MSPPERKQKRAEDQRRRRRAQRGMAASAVRSVSAASFPGFENTLITDVDEMSRADMDAFKSYLHTHGLKLDGVESTADMLRLIADSSCKQDIVHSCATPAAPERSLFASAEAFREAQARWVVENGDGLQLQGTRREQNVAFSRLKDRLFRQRRSRANPSGSQWRHSLTPHRH